MREERLREGDGMTEAEVRVMQCEDSTITGGLEDAEWNQEARNAGIP